ncbi:hypothetical protein D1872_296810 [compost metagenome]
MPAFAIHGGNQLGFFIPGHRLLSVILVAITIDLGVDFIFITQIQIRKRLGRDLGHQLRPVHLLLQVYFAGSEVQNLPIDQAVPANVRGTHTRW